MKYLCLCWFDGTRFDTMTEAEKIAFDRESFAYDTDLAAQGSMVHAEALQSPQTAVTVKVRDGKVSTTDGPFIETKEYVGGFILIEAADMAEAVRIAAGIPLARIGSIEVRPIYQIPQR
jgi:hypothetical protein